MILHWDRCTSADKTIVLNGPDIVLVYTENKTTLSIDIAVLLIHSLPKIERGKITKYENFLPEIKNIWKLNNVCVFPLVITAEGLVIKNFQKHTENISLTKNILRVGQKAVLLQTCILYIQHKDTNKTKKSSNTLKQKRFQIHKTKH
jgi:hypothetical protein